MKTCTKCGVEKPLTEFYLKNLGDRRVRRYGHCKECHKKLTKAWLNKTENRLRINALAQPRQQSRKYGLTLAEYKALLAKMPDGCEVCGKVPSFENQGRRTLYIDHDHATGKIRGFLCHGCNFAIGMVYEDPEVLRRLALYLERHRNTLPASEST
jgi:hypothetical protein